jgi:thioredoxin-dependent peroxiredoxin
VRLVGLSFDTVEDNRAWAESEGFPFQLLSDPERKVGPAYGAVRPPDDPYPHYARRLTFLVDPEGIVRKTYTVTDIPAHPGEVLEDLAALGV